MARYRILPVGTGHGDQWDRVSWQAKGVYLYFACHPSLGPSGIMRLPASGLAGEVGLSPQESAEIIRELLPWMLVEGRWLALRSFATNQGAGAKWQSCISSDIETLNPPESVTCAANGNTLSHTLSDTTCHTVSDAVFRGTFRTTLEARKAIGGSAACESDGKSGDSSTDTSASDTISHTLSDTLSHRVFPQEQEQEQQQYTMSGSATEPDVEAKPDRIPYKRIIDDLNSKAGTAFRDGTRATRNRIRARFNEGFTLDDFLAVNEAMCEAWKCDDKMVAYLRPETLYGTKFEGYLQRARNGGNGRSAPVNLKKQKLVIGADGKGRFVDIEELEEASV